MRFTTSSPLTLVVVAGVCAAAGSETVDVRTLDPVFAEGGRYFSFVTRQDIKAPTWAIHVGNRSSEIAPGYWFIAPYEIKTQEVAGDAWVGPHIYDANGELVWSGTPEFGHWNVFDFDSVEVDGQPCLTGLDWHGQRGVLLDNSYRLRKTAPSVTQGDTFQNMHGFQVVDNGQRALVQTVKHWDVPENITFESIGYHGKCDANYEGFRELDLTSPGGAHVLFDWDARKIGINESTYFRHDGAERLCQNGWDLLHINAVSKFPDGDYLLSARHTDALYKISHLDGDILWRLGGVMSDFKLGEDARFSRQHHARVLDQNKTHTIISVFDNAVGEHFQDPSRLNSRALVLSLDTSQMTADVLTQYEDPRRAFTDGRGSFQMLPNGNAFINWAVHSRISEHSSEGEVLMEAELIAGKDTYRAFKHPWVGKPTAPPDVHAEVEWKEDRRIVTVVSMSWNGATEHASWNVKGLDAKGKRIVIASGLPRTGFETKIEYQGYASNIYAEALDRDGHLLGTSQGSGKVLYAEGTGRSPMSMQIELGLGRCSIGLLLGLAAVFLVQTYRRRRVQTAECVEKGSYIKLGQDDES